MNLPDENDINDVDDEEELLNQNPGGGDENDDDEPGEDDDDLQSAGSGQLTQQQIVDLAARAAMAQHPGQQAPQLTQAELDQRLQRYVVNEDLAEKLFDPETPKAERAKILQAIADGAAKHAVTSSQVLFQGALSPIQQQQEQYNAMVREQKVSLLTKHVETKFPALAGKKQVIRNAIQNLAASGYQAPGGSKSALQKEIAKMAAGYIRQVDPSFRLKQGGQQPRQAGSFGSRRSGGQAPSGNGRSAASSFIDHL